MLRITNVCPLKYGLIFERFLNIERVQMPDIDIDFDDRRRDRVLQYVQGKYGEDRVAQIITFGTMAARAAIRDVGRALNVPLPDVDRLAKLVPLSVKITLDKALDESRELRALYESEGWARQVIDNARRLEGICRNASTHAAGVVIGAEPLTNIVPLQRSTMGDRSTAVTMFDMEGVSAVGLLKVDFLGLTNLTVIEETLQMIEASTGTRIDIDQIPLDDPATYALLSKADTHGIFQLEATFAKRILLDMQPRTLEDVALAGALNRPGPIEGGATAQYIKRKRGELPVEYPVGLEALLRPVLEETHGTIVYQDQVMKIAQAVAGFTLGEADVLRAAMGKKDKAKMAKQREKFLAGAAANGVAEERAIELFDLIAFFAGYGFNKCVKSTTEIVDASTGERTTVGELYDNPRPFTVHGLGDDGVLRARQVTDVVSNGRRPVLTLSTAQGRTIGATANHRFLTFEGWRCLDELSVGDLIAAPRRLPVASGSSWPKHELVVLGGLLSEGNTCHPSCLYFYNNNLEAISDFASAAAQFPLTFPRITRRADGRRMEVCLSSGYIKPPPPALDRWHQCSRPGGRRCARPLGRLPVGRGARHPGQARHRKSRACSSVHAGRRIPGDPAGQDVGGRRLHRRHRHEPCAVLCHLIGAPGSRRPAPPAPAGHPVRPAYQAIPVPGHTQARLHRPPDRRRRDGGVPGAHRTALHRQGTAASDTSRSPRRDPEERGIGGYDPVRCPGHRRCRAAASRVDMDRPRTLLGRLDEELLRRGTGWQARVQALQRSSASRSSSHPNGSAKPPAPTSSGTASPISSSTASRRRTT